VVTLIEEAGTVTKVMKENFDREEAREQGMAHPNPFETLKP
jgi:hypothetical protein